LDTAKVDLSLRSDFTLTDCFRVFDRFDRGQISSSELEEALVLVDIRPVRDEVYLVVKRYSSLGDNQLRYSDFIDMLSPRDPEYRRILSNRPGLRGPISNPRSAFSLETFDRLNRVFRLLLECEMSAERVRQRLSALPRFNYMDAFQTLDKSGDGYITSDEFQEILRQSGFRANRSDLQALMERYDKNRDGRVSYSEFVAEVSPKSPRKY
jgi:Ca2+-binding EF-hand superfamily protein